MWRDEWRRIEARLVSWQAMATTHVENLQFLERRIAGAEVKDAMAKLVFGEAQTIKDLLLALRNRHSTNLPEPVVDAIKRHAQRFPPALTGTSTIALLRLLAAQLRTELNYLLVDTEELLLRSAERAFAHLQRLLVADSDSREKWVQAMAAGEEACERLGATHMLHHGLWAFKVSAAGERTDLVYGDRLVIDDQMRAAANGLVLSEWKLVRATDDPVARQQEALEQAALYSEGSLAGFELQQIRFAVLVSARRLNLPAMVHHREQKYRIVNVAVRALSPSAEARAAAS
jgi:hypothetical protein